MHTTHHDQRHETAAPHATSRRDFLGLAAAAGIGLSAMGVHAQTTKPALDSGHGAMLYPGAIDNNGQYTLPPLPYAYDALEPHIDEETMRLHHDKHHAGYVKGLIGAEEALAAARESGDWSDAQGLSLKQAFHGAGHFLHCIFWANMAPEGKGGEPSATLQDAIAKSFGSHANFEAQFTGAAKSVEGSGWGILAYSIPAKKLVVLQALNHQNATQWGNIPLLVVDVWEHAYYKKYGNLRGDYLTAFMKVVNWTNVGQRYEMAAKMLG